MRLPGEDFNIRSFPITYIFEENSEQKIGIPLSKKYVIMWKRFEAREGKPTHTFLSGNSHKDFSRLQTWVLDGIALVEE